MTDPQSPGACGFADRLFEIIRRYRTCACIGLDPVLERLPEAVRKGSPLEAVREFCGRILYAASGVVPVVKFQSACFERFGSPGIAVLEELIAQARALGQVVILDAKRGDIGLTNEHYAAMVKRLNADAVTVNGYLGMGVVEPFLRAGTGVFVLVRTSNPDGDAIQSERLADGRTVAEMMADRVAGLGEQWLGQWCGCSNVGAVVGATKAADGRELRRRMPRQFFLVPGYGAQGGTLDDVRALVDDRGAGVLVTASRSVTYAFRSTNSDWVNEVGAAIQAFAEEVRPFAG